jgi:hypothetical protein
MRGGRPLVALALALMALILAGCGGGPDDGARRVTASSGASSAEAEG